MEVDDEEAPSIPYTGCECHEIRTTHEDFLETYASAGRVGLVGGVTWIDKVIQTATRRLTGKGGNRWSHAWICQGRRRDGHHWVIESDLDAGSKHRRLGVQENRIGKFANPKECPHLAILDFGLSPDQVQRVMFEALELVANQATYSMLEIIGTAVAVNISRDRKRKNLLKHERSLYCSGMVQYVFYKAGVDLIPGVHPSLGTPVELAASPHLQTVYLLKPTS